MPSLDDIVSSYVQPKLSLQLQKYRMTVAKMKLQVDNREPVEVRAQTPDAEIEELKRAVEQLKAENFQLKQQLNVLQSKQDNGEQVSLLQEAKEKTEKEQFETLKQVNSLSKLLIEKEAQIKQLEQARGTNNSQLEAKIEQIKASYEKHKAD